MKKKRGKPTHRARKKSAKSSAGKRKPSASSKAKSARKQAAKKPTTRSKAKPAISRRAKTPPSKSKKPKVILIEETIRKPPHELEEEFFVPSPIHRGKYRIPVGIRFLIGYLTFLSALYLISFIFGITFPTTILFGKLITGKGVLIFNLVLLLLIFFMIYGFWKRKAYTFDLSIGFFSFAALNSLISLMLFESAEHPVFRKLLLLSFVSLVIMNIVIVWYILHEKKYFYVEKFKDRPFHHRDKVFLYVIIAFWSITLLLGITLGVQFYKDTTRIIDQTMVELKGDYYRGILVCEQKQDHERDICTLVIATALSEHNRPQYELVGLCSDSKSDFYRFTCMRSIST
jgi:hypothetical protein